MVPGVKIILDFIKTNFTVIYTHRLLLQLVIVASCNAVSGKRSEAERISLKITIYCFEAQNKILFWES